MSAPMAVLVDELREYTYVRWTVKHWCHMVSDASFEELHAFAAALGIPRERFQRDHYDLPPSMRARAVAQGAEQVTSSERARRMTGPRGDRHRARRAARPPPRPSVQGGFDSPYHSRGSTGVVSLQRQTRREAGTQSQRSPAGDSSAASLGTHPSPGTRRCPSSRS